MTCLALSAGSTGFFLLIEAGLGCLHPSEANVLWKLLWLLGCLPLATWGSSGVQQKVQGIQSTRKEKDKKHTIPQIVNFFSTLFFLFGSWTAPCHLYCFFQSCRVFFCCCCSFGSHFHITLWIKEWQVAECQLPFVPWSYHIPFHLPEAMIQGITWTEWGGE